MLDPLESAASATAQLCIFPFRACHKAATSGFGGSSSSPTTASAIAGRDAPEFLETSCTGKDSCRANAAVVATPTIITTTMTADATASTSNSIITSGSNSSPSAALSGSPLLGRSAQALAETFKLSFDRNKRCAAGAGGAANHAAVHAAIRAPVAPEMRAVVAAQSPPGGSALPADASPSAPFVFRAGQGGGHGGRDEKAEGIESLKEMLIVMLREQQLGQREDLTSSRDSGEAGTFALVGIRGECRREEKQRSRVRGEGSGDCASVEQFYRLGEEVGRGHFGVVRVCWDAETGEQFACKSVLLSNVKRQEDVNELRAEICMLLRLRGHEHIVSLREVVVDAASAAVHVITEHCEGGDLFEFIARKKRLSEREAALLLRQVVYAVQHMHTNAILHRDLKPENILLVNPAPSSVPASDPVPASASLLPTVTSGAGGDFSARSRSSCSARSRSSCSARREIAREGEGEAEREGGEGEAGEKRRVKVADFGLSLVLQRGQQVRGLAGSPFYMAPEIVKHQTYGFAVDVWSLGVVLYTALAGVLPFYGKDHATIFGAICRAQPDLTRHPWGTVSGEAKHLVRRMLCATPQGRIPLAQVLLHPWMVRHNPHARAQAEAQAQGGAVPRAPPGLGYGDGYGRERERERECGRVYGAGGYGQGYAHMQACAQEVAARSGPDAVALKGGTPPATVPPAHGPVPSQVAVPARATMPAAVAAAAPAYVHASDVSPVKRDERKDREEMVEKGREKRERVDGGVARACFETSQNKQQVDGGVARACFETSQNKQQVDGGVARALEKRSELQSALQSPSPLLQHKQQQQQYQRHQQQQQQQQQGADHNPMSPRAFRAFPFLPAFRLRPPPLSLAGVLGTVGWDSAAGEGSAAGGRERGGDGGRDGRREDPWGEGLGGTESAPNSPYLPRVAPSSPHSPIPSPAASPFSRPMRYRDRFAQLLPLPPAALPAPHNTSVPFCKALPTGLITVHTLPSPSSTPAAVTPLFEAPQKAVHTLPSPSAMPAAVTPSHAMPPTAKAHALLKFEE
ncbi:unnamed protein product [Closterium sp. NIES-64]|nr:unnamed protein product [Closterium sp. NIES-64]